MKLFIGLKKNILLPDSQIIVTEQKSGKAGLKLTIIRYSKLSKDGGTAFQQKGTYIKFNIKQVNQGT